MVLRTPRPPLLWALLAAGCFALVIGKGARVQFDHVCTNFRRGLDLL